MAEFEAKPRNLHLKKPPLPTHDCDVRSLDSIGKAAVELKCGMKLSEGWAPGEAPRKWGLDRELLRGQSRGISQHMPLWSEA